MTSLQKNILKFFVGIIALGLVGLLVLQFWAKTAISEFLSRNMPSNVKFEYQGLAINALKGTLEFQNVSATFMYRDTMLKHTEVKMNVLELRNFSYWDYLNHRTIKFGKILFVQPDIRNISYKHLPKKDTVSNGVVNLKKTIAIDILSLKNANFSTVDENDSVLVKVTDFDFNLFGITIDSTLVKNKLPLAFDSYSLSSSEIYVDLGPYEYVKVDSLHIEDRVLRLHNIKLESKYSKHELSKILTKEHDHIVLDIPQILLHPVNFGFHNLDFFVSVGKGVIEQPKLEIYRDKLIDDDLQTKRLYSRILSELPINLCIDELKINNGHVGYEELINADSKVGRIFFDDVNVAISNLSNTYLPENKTSIAANGIFMGQAPITLDWSFDMNDQNDFFTASTTFSNFETESINQFLEPNLRVRTKGHIDALYFTISGDAVRSSGEMKMKYDDFEFVILKKDLLAINKVLTAIGKMLVANNSNTYEKGYRFGMIAVDRDPTKSFFNYLYMNVRDGVVNTLTGNGKKERSKN
ncbi:MAG: hypothetical protein MUO53_08335 [Maribacter sp.]|nr:hypothetical protein [Maribacter sp.]